MPRPTRYAFFDLLRLRYILLALVLACAGVYIAQKAGWLPPAEMAQPVPPRPGY